MILDPPGQALPSHTSIKNEKDTFGVSISVSYKCGCAFSGEIGEKREQKNSLTVESALHWRDFLSKFKAMKMYVAKNITPMESVNYLFSLRLSRALAVLFTNESSMQILWMFELFFWKNN